MLHIREILEDWELQERLEREQARAELIDLRRNQPGIKDQEREWCDRRDYYQDSWADRI